MKEIFSNEAQTKFKTFGFYQIAGGAIGLFLIFIGFSASSLTTLSILIYLVIFLFFAYSVVCGILCLQYNKNSLRLSLINQILQAIGFAIMGFAFKYVAGIYLRIGLNLTNSFEFTFGAGISGLEINFNNESERLEVDINLVALGLIYWIDKLIRKIKIEEEFKKISQIGESVSL